MPHLHVRIEQVNSAKSCTLQPNHHPVIHHLQHVILCIDFNLILGCNHLIPAAYYSLLALYGLMQCGEVMCLATVMGLDTARYANISARLGKLCADIDSVIG